MQSMERVLNSMLVTVRTLKIHWESPSEDTEKVPIQKDMVCRKDALSAVECCLSGKEMPGC